MGLCYRTMRYQDVAVNEVPDLVKDDAKAKLGRFKAGDHSIPDDYAFNFEWSVRLVRRLLQGESIDEYTPMGAGPLKRERPTWSRRLSAASSSTCIDLTSPTKKVKTEPGSLDKEPTDISAEDVPAHVR